MQVAFDSSVGRAKLGPPLVEKRDDSGRRDTLPLVVGSDEVDLQSAVVELS